MSLNSLWFRVKLAAFRKKASLRLATHLAAVHLRHAYLIYDCQPGELGGAWALCILNEGFGPYLTDLEMALRIEIPTRCICVACRNIVDKWNKSSTLLKDKIVNTYDAEDLEDLNQALTKGYNNK